MPFNQLRLCPSAWQTAVAVILAFVSITPAWAGRGFFRNGAVGGRQLLLSNDPTEDGGCGTGIPLQA